jgi:putative transposase
MSHKRSKATRKAASQIQFDPKVMEALVPGPLTAAEANQLFDGFKKAVFERALGAEMSQHLGYRPGEARPDGQTNHRNGSTSKTVATDTGEVAIDVPRDRHSSFEPLLIGKHERRFAGFDDKIVAMYSRGMSVREIQAHLAEMYAVEVSPSLISEITDAVMADAAEWQSRPLERMYPVVFFDALRVKVRDEGVVANRAVYLALGIDSEGRRDVLGLWIEQTEGAKFWLKVFNDLRNRGVDDILIAVVDGLKGFPEAIEAAFPKTTVQPPDQVGGRLCIVHLIRNSLGYVSWKDRKFVAAALRPIYTAPSVAAAEAALATFEAGPWGTKYATIGQSWRRAWPQIIPFFAFAPEVRRIIYTTNAIESLHMQLRKIIKTRGHFPSEDAATKLIWLALRNVMKRWSRAARQWTTALNQFALLYPDRFTRQAA